MPALIVRNQLRNLVQFADRENAVAPFDNWKHAARRTAMELAVTQVNAVRANDGRKLAKWSYSGCVVLHG